MGYAALEWAFKARHKLAGAGAPVFVAGEEAGGNIAAAVALMARDLQEPALAGQILLSPMLDPCLATASLRDAEAGPVGCTWADGWHNYLPRLEDASHPYAAPGSAFRLAGLPPTLLITAQDDPLRDETLAYAARLRDAGLVAHDTVLPVPTGWPCSYLEPADYKKGLGAHPARAFRPFLRHRAGCAHGGAQRGFLSFINPKPRFSLRELSMTLIHPNTHQRRAARPRAAKPLLAHGGRFVLDLNLS
jgi:acetyl esterase